MTSVGLETVFVAEVVTVTEADETVTAVTDLLTSMLRG